MDFTEIFATLQENTHIFIVLGVVIVVSIVFNVIRFRSMRGSNRRFLEAHPDAAKVYLTTKALAVAGAVVVHSVDGEAPALFAEQGKTGFYATPGTRTVEMSFSYSRPGIVYKTVTKTYGPYKKELIIEAGKNYLLRFDKNSEAFAFEENDAGGR
jgi:hypothetical protein